MKSFRFQAVWLFVALAFALVGTSCGPSGPADDANLMMLRMTFDSGSLPPEHHSSSTFEFDGLTLTRVVEREYGEVLESDEWVELTPALIDDLHSVVRDAELQPVERVTNNCAGGSTVGINLAWDDGTKVSGGQDGSTYHDGPGGDCENYTVEGDMRSIGLYLQSLFVS